MTTLRRNIIGGLLLVLIGLPVLLMLAASLFVGLLNPVLFHTSSRITGTILSAGQKREYLLHVPRSYDRAKSTPLVISLHAAALWPATQMEISQWNKWPMSTGSSRSTLLEPASLLSRFFRDCPSGG